jgi:leucyl-tRNA synthetase
VRDVKQDIVEFLNSQNAASSIYETSTKGLCRCGGQVVVAVEPGQYFLNYGDPHWKEKAFELLDQLKIVPEMYRTQFVQTFKWLDQRPCVRRRGLGTEFPFSTEHWIIEPLSDSVIYMALYTVIQHIRDCEPKRLTPAFFDYIFLGLGDITDVCEQTGLSETVIRAARNDFIYWYPNDHRHTAIAHISNHLSFFLFHHAILFPETCWPKMVTLNELLVREGVKMSKSKGNVIPIATVPEVYSADLVRLCLVSIADLNSTVDWREKEVDMVKKRLLRFWHATKRDVEAARSDYNGQLSFASRWILAATKAMVAKASEAAHQFSYRKYVTEAFFEQLNRVEEYKSMILDGNEKRRTLGDVIDIWLRVLAPVVPHIAEELWERMLKSGYISLAAFPLYDDLYAETLAQKGFLDEVISDVSNIQAAIKRETESIFLYLPAQWKYSLYDVVRELGEPSVKNIMARAKEDAVLRTYLKEIALIAPDLAKSLAHEFPSSDALDLEAESETLFAAKDYMTRKFGKRVHICSEKDSVYDPANRARRALPLKPAIYVE